jgi:hypothetical protein
VQGDYFGGTFDSADFSATGTWSETNEFLGSWFLRLDILRVARACR